MKRAIAILLAGGLAAAAAGPVAAQTYPFRHEVSVFGSWDDVDKPANVEMLNLNLRYGYFVAPQLVATGELVRSSFEGAGVDQTSTSFLVGAKYYFTPLRPQQLAGFVDTAIGFADVDTGQRSDTDLAWQIGVGASLFFNERTSIDGGLRLYWVDTDVQTEGIRFFVGITTRF